MSVAVQNAGYLGDFRVNDSITCKFSTHSSTGGMLALATSPALSVYLPGNTTEITSGLTLTQDYDGRTGLNQFVIDLSASGSYAADTDNYSVVITAGTVGAANVSGTVVADFSIEGRSALIPTTAGRKLDVSTGGEAGVDLANVGSPASALSLPNVTVGTATNVTNAAAAVHSNTAQAGAATTITLDASASASNNAYYGYDIQITGGTGAGQVRQITGYVGNTKVATVDRAWTTAPDATSTFTIKARVSPDGIAQSVLQKMLLAIHAGKATVTDNGTTRTLTYKAQDGTTTVLIKTVREIDGGRTATATPA